MKRSSYFISARSASADLLASELVLAMHDQYQRLDCHGILGEWTGRTRSNKIGDLSQCLSLGLHDLDIVGAEGQQYEAQLVQQLIAHPVNLAILVGYSFLHHRLAAQFKKMQIPVVLYEITPTAALARIDVSKVRERVDVALGITPNASDFVQKSGVPYYYIGSPHKDRVDRVVIEASLLGLDPDKPLITIFPGGRVEGVQSSFALFEALAAKLSENNKIQVVLSLPEGFTQDEEPSPATALMLKGVKRQYRVFSGMHLELLALSRVAICGCGAITVESGLCQVPALSIYPVSETQTGLKSLLNQTMGREIFTELSADSPFATLLVDAEELLGPSARRESLLQELQQLKLTIQGFAAENAAAYIGREVAQWQQQRKSKDSKTA